MHRLWKVQTFWSDSDRNDLEIANGKQGGVLLVGISEWMSSFENGKFSEKITLLNSKGSFQKKRPVRKALETTAL